MIITSINEYIWSYKGCEEWDWLRNGTIAKRPVFWRPFRIVGRFHSNWRCPPSICKDSAQKTITPTIVLHPESGKRQSIHVLTRLHLLVSNLLLKLRNWSTRYSLSYKIPAAVLTWPYPTIATTDTISVNALRLLFSTFSVYENDIQIVSFDQPHYWKQDDFLTQLWHIRNTWINLRYIGLEI